MTETPIAAYLLDNYGSCDIGPACYFKGCRATEWIGRDCPHWRPLGVPTLDELRKAAEIVRK